MKTLVMVLNEHLPLVIIVAVYIAAGYCVQFGFQIDKMMSIRLSYLMLNIFSIYFSCIFLVVQIGRKKILHPFYSKKHLGFSFGHCPCTAIYEYVFKLQAGDSYY